MRRRKYLVFALLLGASFGIDPIMEWMAFPYPDMSAYRSDDRSERLDYIEQVLGEHGVPISEKWVLRFVDRMLLFRLA